MSIFILLLCTTIYVSAETTTPTKFKVPEVEYPETEEDLPIVPEEKCSGAITVDQKLKERKSDINEKMRRNSPYRNPYNPEALKAHQVPGTFVR